MKNNGKYMKPSSRPQLQIGSLMMRVAAVLLCLVMGSFYLMGGMFARYTTNGTGSDDARVAKFDVKVTGDAAAVSVDCAVSTDNVYTITIKNDSEVAVNYKIKVETSVNEGSDDFDKTGVTTELDSDSGSLIVGGTANHTLTFTVNDWSKITQYMTGENDKVTLKFNVTVDIVQID